VAVALPFHANDLGVVCEPVDEGDGARRVGKDGGPVLEDEI
jgi:hypothetical protein